MSLTKSDIEARIEQIKKDMETVRQQIDMLGTQNLQLVGHLNSMQWALDTINEREKTELHGEPGAIEGSCVEPEFVGE